MPHGTIARVKTISLKLPDVLDNELAVFARRSGLSKSEVARQALSRHLAVPRSRRGRSLLSGVGDLVGCVLGPADLSTNKRRLAGYGR